MKKYFKWILTVAIIILVISFAFYSNHSRSVTGNEKIQIGAVLPLTGSLASMGEQIKDGTTLAVEDINQTNSKKVNVNFEDSRMDPKEAISAVNRLIGSLGIQYLTVAATPMILAVQPITEKAGSLLAAVSVSPSVLKNSRYTFRAFYNQDQAVEKIVEYIKLHHYQNISSLIFNMDVLQGEIDAIKAQGVTISQEEKFDLDQNDFRTQLTKIKAAKPDLVIMFGYGAKLSYVLKQMQELGMQNTHIIGGLDFLDIINEMRMLPILSNTVFTVPSFNVSESASSLDFDTRFTKRFGIAPNHFAAYAYDTLNLMYLGIINTDGKPSNVISYLKSLNGYKGVTGTTTLVNGDMRGDLSFARYKDGRLSEVK